MARRVPFPPSSIPAYIEQSMKLFVCLSEDCTRRARLARSRRAGGGTQCQKLFRSATHTVGLSIPGVGARKPQTRLANAPAVKRLPALECHPRARATRAQVTTARSARTLSCRQCSAALLRHSRRA